MMINSFLNYDVNFSELDNIFLLKLSILAVEQTGCVFQ